MFRTVAFPSTTASEIASVISLAPRTLLPGRLVLTSSTGQGLAAGIQANCDLIFQAQQLDETDASRAHDSSGMGFVRNEGEVPLGTDLPRNLEHLHQRAHVAIHAGHRLDRHEDRA